MSDSRSAAGLRVHTPFGPRKSGIPESVEIPAPVSATTRRAEAIQARTASMVAAGFIAFFRSFDQGCDCPQALHCIPGNVRPDDGIAHQLVRTRAHGPVAGAVVDIHIEVTPALDGGRPK